MTTGTTLSPLLGVVRTRDVLTPQGQGYRVSCGTNARPSIRQKGIWMPNYFGATGKLDAADHADRTSPIGLPPDLRTPVDDLADRVSDLVLAAMSLCSEIEQTESVPPGLQRRADALRGATRAMVEFCDTRRETNSGG